MEERDEINIILGGPQGSGLETISQIMTTAFVKLGYGVISDREYHSNIIGRHSYIHMKVSSQEEPISIEYPVQIIASMDAETIFTHQNDLAPDGILIYDTGVSKVKLEDVKSMEEEVKRRLKNITIEELINNLNCRKLGINFKQILSNLTEKYNIPATQVSRYISAIIVGAIAKILRINEKALTYALNVRFEGRESLVKTNMHVIKMIDEIVGEEYEIKIKKPKPRYKEYMVVSGNDIVGIAKIIGGVRYQSYYPITPAADESLFIESYERITMENGDEIGICVLQTEDEIAAISSVIGASLAGARSTTTTSGPGFSLMVEALGWAGNNETPILITYYQRGAPSTGLPTRGGQADLLFTLSASHGEFPRIVLTSGDHIEAFYDTIEALNLAERYQVPVIHLLDKFIANTIASIPIPNIDEIKIDRGNIVHEEGDYKRFDLNNIISPRAYIGSKAISWYTGDEHNEEGHITEDPVTRAKMYEKRMNKMKLIETETPQKLKYTYLDEGKDCLLISWGSTKGVCIDALKTLRSIYGINGSHLNIKMFSPFPSKEISQIISKYEIDKIIMVENNYLSQASMVISMHTGKIIENRILKYTGRPIYKDELVKAIRKILSGKSKMEVLMSGA